MAWGEKLSENLFIGCFVYVLVNIINSSVYFQEIDGVHKEKTNLKFIQYYLLSLLKYKCWARGIVWDMEPA